MLNLTEGPTATTVYGQPGFNSLTAGLSALGLNSPQGVEVGSDGTLFVADTGNNRVLFFPPISSNPSASNIAAIDVLGQTSLTGNLAGAALDALSAPVDIAYDALLNCLWVVDSGNNRILRFPNILFQLLNNISSLNVELKFLGRSLNALLLPSGKLNPLLFLSPLIALSSSSGHFPSPLPYSWAESLHREWGRNSVIVLSSSWGD